VRTGVVSPHYQPPFVLRDWHLIDPPPETTPELDAVAFLLDERPLVSLVHRGIDGPIDVEIALSGHRFERTVTITKLTGERPWVRNTLDDPEGICPREYPAGITGGCLTLTIPPFSMAQVDVPLRLG
jgi:alpha-N-arabinofuranosidase